MSARPSVALPRWRRLEPSCALRQTKHGHVWFHPCLFARVRTPTRNAPRIHASAPLVPVFLHPRNHAHCRRPSACSPLTAPQLSIKSHAVRCLSPSSQHTSPTTSQSFLLTEACLQSLFLTTNFDTLFPSHSLPIPLATLTLFNQPTNQPTNLQNVLCFLHHRC